MSNLQKYLPQRLRLKKGFIHGLTIGVDTQTDKILGLTQACIDQFFLTTASGKYLIQLGEEQGFVMPANSGLDIRAYRVLVPLMASAPKQVKKTISDIIEAFYGTEKTRPNITSTISEPYYLNEGDNLIIETEKGSVDISILSSQVSDLTAVSATEISSIINSSQNAIYADTVTDKITYKKYLRLFTTSSGTIASIRIIGGTLQNVLQFPNTIPTLQEVGTNWVITKQQFYTDVTTFTWDNIGTNPNIYNVQINDIVTIRNFPTTNSLSKLNGTYKVVDVGYDYFSIRNTEFDQLSASYQQLESNNVFFTAQTKITIYDGSEYGITSETTASTATITIPAIPPLTRRFLQGSWHIHGGEYDVLSFDRNTIQIQVGTGLVKPTGINSFLLKNDRMLYDFVAAQYKTTGCDQSTTTPTYYMVNNDPTSSILPPTSPTALPTDPIYMEPDSDKCVISFNNKHGIISNSSIQLDNIIGVSNITSILLNTEHIPSEVVTTNTIVCTIKNISGIPIKFNGITFGLFDINRYSTTQIDTSDFYLTFSAALDVISSGLYIGAVIKLDKTIGTVASAPYAAELRQRKLIVTSINSNVVNVYAGLGVGSPSSIITSTQGYRSAHFGGSAGTYYMNLSSAWNQANVLAGLKLTMMAYTPSSNPKYYGNYIYDPKGVQSLNTMSRLITYTTQEILRGDNSGIIFVSGVDGLNGLDFPSSGKIMLDYGSDGKEGPISYIAAIQSNTGDSQLLLDPSYRFKTTHATGATVQYIHETVAYVPNVNGKDFQPYITGTAQTRNTLILLLEDLLASGIFLEKDILIPTLIYSDSAIDAFD